jgi:hypothetical protein
VAALVSIATVGGVVLMLDDGTDVARDEECVRQGDEVLKSGADAVNAVAVVKRCLGGRAAGPEAAAAMKRYAECDVQQKKITSALRALGEQKRDEAQRLLAFQPQPCTLQAHAAATKRAEAQRPAGSDRPAPAVPVESPLKEQARRELVEAERRIGANDLAGAKQSLDSAEATGELKDRVAALRAKLDMATERLGGMRPATHAAVDPVIRAPGSSSQAETLLEEARELNRKRDFVGSKSRAEQCLKLERNNAQCHKLLGASLSALGDAPGGAREYQTFLDLAPDDPQAPKVRLIIDAYRSRAR